MGTATDHSVPDQVKPNFFGNFALGCKEPEGYYYNYTSAYTQHAKI